MLLDRNRIITSVIAVGLSLGVVLPVCLLEEANPKRVMLCSSRPWLGARPIIAVVPGPSHTHPAVCVWDGEGGLCAVPLRRGLASAWVTGPDVASTGF